LASAEYESVMGVWAEPPGSSGTAPWSWKHCASPYKRGTKS